MDNFLKKGFSGLVLLIFIASLSACVGSSDGGGGGSSSGTSDPTAASGSDALTLSSTVSVVEAQDDSDLSSSTIPGSQSIALNGGQITRAIAQAINVNGFGADSDYNRDTIDVWVHEESIQAFDTVNQILCSIDQSGYGDMIDQGDYRAQIDSALCSSSNDNATEQIEASQNQSSSSNANDYEEWVVNSSRETDQPHIVKVWITQEADEQDPEKMIMAKMLIYQSASDSNPFGYFKMNFVAYSIDTDGNANTDQDPYFKGFIKTVIDNDTGDTLLQFSNSGNFGGETFTEQATLQRATSGSSGGGTLTAPEWGESGVTGITSFNIAYDDDFFLRQKGSETAQCYSRSSFDKTVWDYAMYDNTGARVEIESGFPIKYVDGSDTYYGWVGYYGLWMPEEASISDGDTVFKQDWSNNQTVESEYTVCVAGGRLIKHTKKTMTLGDLKNAPLQWYDSGTNYRVEWDGSNLKKTAQLDQTNWVWTEITEETIDLSSEWGFSFWSEALGGSGFFSAKDSTNSYQAPSNSTTVVFHLQDIVYPTDTVPSTLLCYENCPDATSLADNTAVSLTKTDKNWWSSTAPASFTYHSYTFSTSDMLLKDSGTAAVMSSTNQNQSWGFHSGVLFEDSAANHTAMQCEWSASETCNWRAWDNLSVYYTWETGPENWNKFTAIKSGGTFAKFDAPKKVTYTHSQSDTSAYDYKYNGAKFQLDYSGYGNLHGIPGHCIDSGTGEATSCDSDSRWVPELNILPGSTVTDVSSSTEYVIKPLHVEQRMASTSLSDCSGLTLTTFSLPDISGWEDPDIGAKPTITDAPAVIAGEVQ